WGAEKGVRSGGRRTPSASRWSRASTREPGYLAMPAASLSFSVRSPGSTATGAGGSSARSMPSNPAAINPPNARYGLAEASAGLYSRVVEASSSPQKVDGTRRGASRVSGPQQVNAEPQGSGSKGWKQ